MPDPRPDRTRRWAVRRLLLLLVFVAVVGTVGFLLPPLDLDTIRAQAEAWGWLGAVVFTLSYAALTLAPVPKNLIGIAAGVVWGFAAGSALVYLGALLGAAASFVIGRRLGRDAVERLSGSRLDRLDAALERRGLLAVLGLRLIPVVPFTLINYGAGLTSVRRRDYALGTALGIIPGTLAYVALGAFGVELGWPFWLAVAALGVLAIGGAVVGLRLRSRRTREDAADA